MAVCFSCAISTLPYQRLLSFDSSPLWQVVRTSVLLLFCLGCYVPRVQRSYLGGDRKPTVIKVLSSSVTLASLSRSNGQIDWPDRTAKSPIPAPQRGGNAQERDNRR
jgi:hypothetical protein